MGAPDATVLAYRETRDTVVREYGLRLVTTACVAWIVTTVSSVSTALLWWAAMAALLGAEALSYRHIFRTDRESMPPRIVVFLAALSSLCAIAYTFPVWLLAQAGTPAALFTAAAFMAGTLIHLTVHNANTRIIYASAATPMSVALVGLGAHLSAVSGSVVPAAAAILFILAMIAAYVGRLKNIRQVNEAMAVALAEREAARRASEAKSQFLAKMSHELRTPLNGILGMAEALRDGPLAGEQKTQAAIIVESGETLLEILSEILDHAKIEANRVTLDKRPERLADIVGKAGALFRSTAAQKGILLDVDLSGIETAWLSLDASRLRQCLVNLVANAVKFTHEGGVLIKARTSRIEGGTAAVEIEVSDTGVGIAGEQLERIFEAFEQADNSVTRGFGGTGLGLAIARGIARAMGGDISVSSTPGKGSTFRLAFQTEAASEPARVAERPAAPGAALDGVRVLLVEDNNVNRQVVRTLLGGATTVVEAVNGEEALRLLAGQRFDVVLMDLHMPVMDGFAATRAIRASRASWSAVPVIALSAAALDEDRAQSMAAGVDEFLSKPVKARELHQTIERCIAERTPVTAAASY